MEERSREGEPRQQELKFVWSGGPWFVLSKALYVIESIRHLSRVTDELVDSLCLSSLSGDSFDLLGYHVRI